MTSILARKPITPYANTFDIAAHSAEISHVNFAAVTVGAGYYNDSVRDSTGAQNAEVVFGLPNLLQPGTWKLAFMHRTSTDRGIATIAVSSDGVTWTDLTTFDTYSAANASAVRLTTTGLTMPAGVRFVRVKMAAKNASSTNYTGSIQGISGARTGA